jgi:hypothetical protein
MFFAADFHHCAREQTLMRRKQRLGDRDVPVEVCPGAFAGPLIELNLCKYRVW